jgi:hypothetical protein
MTTTIGGSYPAVNSDSDATINGLTVGKGGGAVASNTAVGYQAINASATGTNNTAVGYQAANANTSGYSVSAFGQAALKSNTTGAQSTAVGGNSLTAATTADNNTALGFQAGFKTTTGSSNVMAGLNAMYENTTGGSNTAIGQQALLNNTTASNNTAVGYQAGYSNTTGTYSTYVGYQAGTNATGGFNTGFGEEALKAATGTSNTAIGASSGYLITSGSKNTIIGAYSGNQGGLDIRTASNRIVLSDGDGNPRGYFDDSGNFLVGKFAPTTATVGCEMRPNGIMACTRVSGPPLSVNRTTDDGDLVSFQQDGTQEGSISVSGTTVSYNGGHLSRWSQWQNQTGKPEVYRGSVLESTNDMCDWGQANEQATKTIVSTTAKSKAVAGVFDMYDLTDETNPYDFYVAQSGDFVIRIAQGVAVENGDLLESAGDGTARPQTDDICRSSTVAKVTSNYVSITYADGSYCVPCILMIG